MRIARAAETHDPVGFLYGSGGEADGFRDRRERTCARIRWYVQVQRREMRTNQEDRTTCRARGTSGGFLNSLSQTNRFRFNLITRPHAVFGSAFNFFICQSTCRRIQSTQDNTPVFYCIKQPSTRFAVRGRRCKTLECDVVKLHQTCQFPLYYGASRRN